MSGTASEDRPVSSLRGARVEVDARRAGRVLVALGLAAVVVTAVALLYSGARKNSQIQALRTHGVPVTMTVDGCRGLLGGSGSNAAGYSCWGSFREAGRRFAGYIPGDALRAPGSTVRVVTVAGDPALLTTPAELSAEAPSSRVFLLPAGLLGSAALAVTGLAVRRRRRQRASRPPRRFLRPEGGRLGEALGGV